MTAEQFEALDLLWDNERCFFEGAAGTGKTVLALEYARRSSAAGQRTLVVCYNRLLGDWLERQASEWPSASRVTAGPYFKLLRSAILRSSIASEFLDLERRVPADELYGSVYSTCGRLAVEEGADRFDSLVMDEGQDLLRPGVLEVLDAWLIGGLKRARWAVFGDFQRQAIFGEGSADQLRNELRRFAPDWTRGRLSLNCRNTRNIGEETALLSGFASPPYRLGHVTGPPVDYRFYKSADNQRVLLGEVLHQLLAGGVKPSDIVVLSRYRFENSCAADLDGGRRFQLTDCSASIHSRAPAVRFATAHAFKGMESPVVVLCDVDQLSGEGSQALLYVAMSRARSHLTVLVREDCRPAIAACVRRKLQESWSTAV